jgi:glycosyltransferase involved in cell wall biosynthesis
LALGLPVVTTNVGGIPYFVDSSLAWLVDDGDYAAMANQIVHMKAHPELVSRKVASARLFVENEFTLKSVLNAWNILILN